MALVIQDFGEDDFDEEAVDREACEIEKTVDDFVDEPSIQHDVIPESDDEGKKHQKTPREQTHIRHGDGRLYKHQTFFNGVAFKECVLDYALRTGDDCSRKIYASILPNDPIWRVRVFEDKHSCVPNGQCKMLKVPHIARLFVDKIRDEPQDYMPMKIEETVLEKWGINVTRSQCQAARNKALRWIETEYNLQFARLRDYAAELIDSNKGSTVVIETLKNAEGKEEFNRFYVCFDVIKTTCKETCRPLVGLDGTFIKHKIKGQLLVALRRDADNGIYPIAWAVVQAENTDNWTWFVQKIKHDLTLNDGDGFIMISDRHRGLIAAVKLELPKIEHRMCVRHIYDNIKKNHGKKTKPRTWCRAFYKMGNYCEDVENNSTESFNNTIKKARELPFVPMLEMVRRLAMARIAKRKAKSHNHKGICTPYVAKFLAKEKKIADDCKVAYSTNGEYKARVNSCSYRVNLEKRTCTCMKFQICGIPCEHAYGVINHKKLIPEDFVCHWFRTAMWKRNYTNGISPVRGASFWPATGAPNVHIPPKPLQPGRKKITKTGKERKKGVNESPKKKADKVKKRIMHCKICGEANHNARLLKLQYLKVKLHKVLKLKPLKVKLLKVKLLKVCKVHFHV
ncbi:uncharacterized protein LOC112086665 [Eutrema salsugineum]|uniref:uncharacterized protein LOC112086665 n=1 Tax=Eutrema salsugineum TaxID=72664 RepID=UPI000CED2AAF|nr:uncharacterized protein LOC112086665 [Eutrema salsugineum]